MREAQAWKAFCISGDIERNPPNPPLGRPLGRPLGLAVGRPLGRPLGRVTPFFWRHAVKAALWSPLGAAAAVVPADVLPPPPHPATATASAAAIATCT
jgi:hypothetical protein